MLDWFELVETLMQRLGLKSDKELAALLRLSPQMVSNWRNRRSDLGMVSKILILDKLGYAYTRDTVLAILPSDMRKQLLEASHDRTGVLVDRKTLDDYGFTHPIEADPKKPVSDKEKIPH